MDTTSAAMEGIITSVQTSLTSVQTDAIIVIGLVVGIGIVVVAAKFLPKMAVGFFKSFAK